MPDNAPIIRHQHGDLTIEATVTEDITGAIADSVNQAVEEMRGLVTTINETSVRVSASAQETRATAMHLSEASDHQRDQIVNASDIVPVCLKRLQQKTGPTIRVPVFKSMEDINLLRSIGNFPPMATAEDQCVNGKYTVFRRTDNGLDTVGAMPEVADSRKVA